MKTNRLQKRANYGLNPVLGDLRAKGNLSARFCVPRDGFEGATCFRSRAYFENGLEPIDLTLWVISDRRDLGSMRRVGTTNPLCVRRQS
jgi:hypothetical protein